MKPTAGDVIYADRFWYKHYGIYVDKTTVIHYATDDDSSDGDNAYVHETTPRKFAQGDEVYRLDFPNNSDEWDATIQSLQNVSSSPILFNQTSIASIAPTPNPVETIAGIIYIGKKIGEFLFGHENDENPHLFTPQETIQRAKSRLGEHNYSLPFNNCEHFAIWCKTGMSESTQVDKIIDVLTLVSTRNNRAICW